MSILIVTVCICIFVALFAMQNAASVSLNFLFIEFESSLAVLTLTSFLCGVLAAGCYIVVLKTRQYMKDRKTKEAMAKLEQEKQTLADEKAKLEELVTYLKEHQGQMPEEPKPKQQAVRNPYIRR